MMTITPPSSAKSPPPAPHPLPPRPIPKTTRVLAALIKKELRQHALFIFSLVLPLCLLAPVFGYLAFLADSLIGSVGIAHVPPQEQFNLLVHPLWQISSVVAFPLIGFFIGACQAFADRNFDLWSFLIHRPASRSIQFLARTIAGLLLYAASAGVLLLIVIGIAAQTADFFHWRFTLPSIADCAAGIVYYFAALLTFSRAALYYGSKFIPCAAAAACSLAVILSPWFSLALVFVILFSMLFAVAAWGSTLSHGYTLAAPRRARITLNFILLLSCALLLTLAMVSLSPLIQRLPGLDRPQPLPTAQVVPQSQPEEPHIPYVTTYYEVMHDGTLAKIVTTWRDWLQPGPDALETHLFDTQGHEFLPPANWQERSQEQGTELSNMGHAREAQETPHHYRRFGDQIESHTRFIPSYYETGIDPVVLERWYYDELDRLYFCYSESPNRFLGTLGANGFSPPGAAATPWPADLMPIPTRQGIRYTTKHELLYLNLSKHEIEHYFSVPEDETILDVADMRDDVYPPQRTDLNEVVLTAHNIYLMVFTSDIRISDTQKSFAKFPIEMASQIVGVRIFSDTRLMTLDYSKIIESEHRYHHIYEVFTYPDGKPVARYDIPGRSSIPLSRPSQPALPSLTPPHTRAPEVSPQLMAQYLHTTAAVGGVFDAISGPVIAIPAGELRVRIHVEDPKTEEMSLFSKVPDQPLRHKITFTFLTFAAIGTFLVAKRYRVAHSYIWTLLTFIFGPGTMLALIAAHWLPRQTPCPSCHKPRPFNEAHCPHCHAPFPAIPKDATEVFA